MAKLLPSGFPPPPPTQSQHSSNLKSVYNDEPSLQFLKSRLPANTELLNAGKELLEAERSQDDEVVKMKEWICKALHKLEVDKNYSREQFRQDVEELKDQLPAAVAEKYKDLLNLSDALNPNAVALFIGHFAPNSCKDHVDKKEYSSKHCRTDRKNVCLRMTELWAKSLHKEAGGGKWSEEASKMVNERFVIVDAKILVTDETESHRSEFKQFCEENDISMAQMNLIGLILVGFVVKHHELGDKDHPLFIIVPSAAAHQDLFSRHGYYQTISTLFLEYIPHFQNFATKTIANLLLYPPERLEEYSARLLCLYGAIANDIGNPDIFSVPTVLSKIAERYAGIVNMTEEEIKDLRENMRALHDLRSDVGELARYLRRNGLANTAEEVYALLKLYCEDRRGPEMWWASHLGGVETGKMMTQAVECRTKLIKRGDVDASDDTRCLVLIKSELSEKHANLLRPVLMRSAAKALLDKAAASGHVDRDDSDACFEYIKENMTEKHAELWWACHLGGVTTGKKMTEAVEHRIKLIKAGEVEAGDDKRCLELIESQLSVEHANLLRPVLKRSAAKVLLDKASASGHVNRDDSDACFEYIEKNLSKEHAELWWGSHLGGVQHGKMTVAANKLGNGEHMEKEEEVLAWKERLRRLKFSFGAIRKQLCEMSKDCREGAIAHVYECARCSENTPVVRFNQNQLSRCNNPCCVGAKYLPTAPDGSNEWWKYVESLDADGLDEHLHMKTMKIQGKIDELTAASLGGVAPTHTHTTQSNSLLLPSPSSITQVATQLSSASNSARQKRKVTDHSEKMPSKKVKSSSKPAATTAPNTNTKKNVTSVASLPKRRRKPCSEEGCKNQSYSGGLCKRHGAKAKQCSHEGCTSTAQKGGVCRKHGKLCSREGCTNQVLQGGLCWRHGAKAKQSSRK